jgi:hypothetical protein
LARQLDGTIFKKIIKPVEITGKFILVIVLADACLAAALRHFFEYAVRAVTSPPFY